MGFGIFLKGIDGFEGRGGGHSVFFDRVGFVFGCWFLGGGVVAVGRGGGSFLTAHDGRFARFAFALFSSIL